MTQKIIKVGTSAAVTISKAALAKLGWRTGNTVDVRVDARMGDFRVRRSVHTRKASGKKKELAHFVATFISKHKKALKALSDK